MAFLCFLKLLAGRGFLTECFGNIQGVSKENEKH